MRALGRLMQMVVFFTLPLAMVMELTGAITLGQMLVAMVGGVCLFLIGRIIEGYSR
jgi:hypothetical protein